MSYIPTKYKGVIKMDMLKKIFPFSFKIETVKTLLINCLIYLLVGIVLGVVIGIVAKIPVIGILVGIVGGLVDLYVLVGIVIAFLTYFKVIK